MEIVVLKWMEVQILLDTVPPLFRPLYQWHLSEKLWNGNLLEYGQLELKHYKLHRSEILLAVLSHVLYKIGGNF